MKEGKDDDVYNKLLLTDNLLNTGFDLTWKVNDDTVAKYSLTRIYFKNPSEHSINGA